MALLVLVLVHEPLQESLAELPNVLASSSKLSVGSVTLEVARQVRAAGDPQLARAVRDLKRSEVRLLIHLALAHRDDRSRSLVTSHRKEGGEVLDYLSIDHFLELRALEEKGLVDFEPTRLADFIGNLATWQIRSEATKTASGTPELRLHPASALDRDHPVYEQTYRLTPQGVSLGNAFFDAVVGRAADSCPPCEADLAD